MFPSGALRNDGGNYLKKLKQSKDFTPRSLRPLARTMDASALGLPSGVNKSKLPVDFAPDDC